MEVLAIPILVSLGLVALGVILLAWGLRQGDHEHIDRLSLLPNEPDTGSQVVHNVQPTPGAPVVPERQA